MSMKSRREFIVAAGGGLTAASCARRPLAGVRSATPADTQGLIGDGRKRRILLRGGVVLSLDAKVGDFEKADVLIDGKLIAQVAPTVSATDAEVVDCSGTIVMPGFITTHHHQYETLQRSIIADGLLGRGLAAGELWVRGSEHLDGRPHRRSEGPDQVHLGPGTCAVRPGGLLHLRARDLPERDQRGRHLWNRYLASQSHARAHRRDDQGADGLRPPDGLRLQRRNQPERGGHPVRSPRSHERHHEGHRSPGEDLLQLKGSTGDAWLVRGRRARIPGRHAIRGGSWPARSAR